MVHSKRNNHKVKTRKSHLFRISGKNARQKRSMQKKIRKTFFKQLHKIRKNLKLIGKRIHESKKFGKINKEIKVYKHHFNADIHKILEKDTTIIVLKYKNTKFPKQQLMYGKYLNAKNVPVGLRSLILKYLLDMELLHTKTTLSDIQQKLNSTLVNETISFAKRIKLKEFDDHFIKGLEILLNTGIVKTYHSQFTPSFRLYGLNMMQVIQLYFAFSFFKDKIEISRQRLIHNYLQDEPQPKGIWDNFKLYHYCCIHANENGFKDLNEMKDVAYNFHKDYFMQMERKASNIVIQEIHRFEDLLTYATELSEKFEKTIDDIYQKNLDLDEKNIDDVNDDEYDNKYGYMDDISEKISIISISIVEIKMYINRLKYNRFLLNFHSMTERRLAKKDKEGKNNVLVYIGRSKLKVATKLADNMQNAAKLWGVLVTDDTERHGYTEIPFEMKPILNSYDRLLDIVYPLYKTNCF